MTSEEIFKQVEEIQQTNFVTAKFGSHWKEYAKEILDIDAVIDIAHVQGRKVILLENVIRQLLGEK